MQDKVIAIRWHLENFLATFNNANPKNKKLFIHIPKNAGMTIRRSDNLRDKIVVARRHRLLSTEYSSELLATMKRTGDHHGFEHARWRDINPRVTNIYNSFAVIRNPWARVVSRFLFAKLAIKVQKKVPPTKSCWNLNTWEEGVMAQAANPIERLLYKNSNRLPS